jgi:arylsulfatase
MLVTQGGRFGGYGFYFLSGKPTFVYNFLDIKRTRWQAPGALQAGRHVVEFAFKYDGLGVGTLAFDNASGIGRGGTGVLKVDGREVARGQVERSIPTFMPWGENFDIGDDTATPVAEDYTVPFPFNGKLIELTLTIDRPKLTPEDEKRLEAAEHNRQASE